MQEQPELFQITITETGKKYIQKFAAISIVIMVLVFFENCYSIYLNIKMIIGREKNPGTYRGFNDGLYWGVLPYLLSIASLFSIISNIFYTRFPRLLLRSINNKDELRANESFKTIYTGAIIFLVWMLIGTAASIWSFLVI